MGIKILQERRVEEVYSYFIEYRWRDDLGAGFWFDCNQDGDINFNDMSEAALENYEKCESGEYDVEYMGLQRSVNRIVHPRIGKCSCGAEIELENFTNRCKCGQYYNWCGQSLKDPEHWGEETGEHYLDILRIK